MDEHSRPMGENPSADPERGEHAGAGNATLRGGAVKGRVGQETTGWHTRRYMPHLDSNELVQHVTFHLADSLPKDALDRLAADLERVDPRRRYTERRRRLEAMVDAGHGSCVLRQPEVAVMTQDALLHFDGERYNMLAWVVMPNHVHALFRSINGWDMARIVASWKSWTGRKIREAIPLRADEAVLGRGALPGMGARRARVWHREYWDRFIRDEKHFAAAVQYIHHNPVKAGLARTPEEWTWSSAHPGKAGRCLGDR